MKVYLLALLFLLLPFSSHSIEDTAVLPKGVRSLLWKQGYVDSLTERFGNDSKLYSLDGRLSKNFDAKQILSVHPRAPELIDALNNRVLKGYDLGDKLNLGQLEFNGTANLQYMAPVFAYGLSDKWTVAVAVPFAKVDADIQIRHTGASNAKQIYDGLAARGDLDAEADAAFKNILIPMDLRKEFFSQLSAKQYKPLETSSSWLLGDVQVVSKYKYYESPKWILLNKVVFNLPTGRADDPNSFVDIPIFHRRFIEVTQVQDFIIQSRWVFGSALTYIWNLPDQISKRVPSSDVDYLPDYDRLEYVKRDTGDGLRWELNTRYALNSSVSFVGAYVGNYKVKDYYSGNRKYDYSLLSRDTEIYFHKYELQASYSAVDDFLNKKASVPYAISYRYSDVFSGKNIERQNAHELTLMVFF